MSRHGFVKCGALLLVVIVAASAAGADSLALYWTDRSLGALRRADLRTQTVVTLVDGLPGPQGVAVDPVEGYVYWADTTSREILRCRLDGSGLERVVVVDGFPKGLDLDEDGRGLYWADPVLRSISRYDLETGAVELVVSGIGIPQDVGYDPRSGRVLWVESAVGIFSAPAEELPAPAGDAFLITPEFVGQATVFAIAEDRARVYWGAAQKLRSSGLFGDCFERYDPVIGTVKGIDYDESSERLFWIEEELGAIFSADPDGEGLELVIAGEPEPWRLAVGPASVAPRVIEQPESGLVPLGGDHELRVRASRGGEARFQWRRDGEPLAESARFRGTTGARLTIQSFGPRDAGRYDCVVSWGERTETTETAVVALEAEAFDDPRADPSIELWRRLLERLRASESSSGR